MDKFLIGLGCLAVGLIVGITCSPTTKTIRTVERVKLDDESEEELRIMKENPALVLELLQKEVSRLVASGGCSSKIRRLTNRIADLQIKIAASNRQEEEVVVGVVGVEIEDADDESDLFNPGGTSKFDAKSGGTDLGKS